MPARRQLHQSSRRVDTGQLVNKFGSHAEQDTQRDARQRRDDDQRLVALLIEGGLADVDAHAAPPGSDDQYVCKRDGLTESLGRAIRRHQMFAAQAYRTKVKHGLGYTVFAGEHGVDAVRQIRVAAPVCSIPLTALRRTHADTSRRLSDRLRYGIARHAPGVSIDLIAAHVHRDGDDTVYLHYHLVGRGGTDAEWAALESYWVGGTGRPQTGWLWWSAEDEDRLGRHPAALVQYAAKGLAEELSDEWTPEELVKIWHQTRGVALIRATGEYRRWLSRLDADGMTVQRHPVHGAVEKVPRRPAVRVQRLKENLFTSCGFTVLRTVWHDLGDGVLREVWHVRGRPGVTAAEIRAVYRDALDTSTEGRPTPESPKPLTVTRPPRPPDPSPRRRWITAPELEEIPW